MIGVFVPDAVAHDFVEAEAEFGGAATDRMHKLWIEKRFAARQAEDADALSVSVFQEAHADGNVQAIGPFDGYAAMAQLEVALIGGGERG